MEGVVIVFDFDETIIDCDSDIWVADDLGVASLFNSLINSMPWNAASIRMMEELHAQGRSIDEIKRSLKRIPLSPHIISAIKSAHALGCDLRILSDANTFFIETVLKHHGVRDCFTKIYTNPGFAGGEAEGKLIISPYHDLTTTVTSHPQPHCCKLCPPNLCKGNVIEKIRGSELQQASTRFIYVGDGKGDYCPALRLRADDTVMPRKGYPLWSLIHGNLNAVKAEVRPWSDHAELEKSLLGLPGVVPESCSVVSESDGTHSLIPVDSNTAEAMQFQFVTSRV